MRCIKRRKFIKKKKRKLLMQHLLLYFTYSVQIFVSLQKWISFYVQIVNSTELYYFLLRGDLKNTQKFIFFWYYLNYCNKLTIFLQIQLQKKMLQEFLSIRFYLNIYIYVYIFLERKHNFKKDQILFQILSHHEVELFVYVINL